MCNSSCHNCCVAHLQFLKLGAAGALPGLSAYFLIWDMDMVPLRPLPLLTPPLDAAAAASMGGSAYQVLRHFCASALRFRWPVLAAAPLVGCSMDCCAGLLAAPMQQRAAATRSYAQPLQTLVNIGGASDWLAGYNATYMALFGQPLALAPDGSSLVTHMLVRPPL
jgi:hypothetical protein